MAFLSRDIIEQVANEVLAAFEVHADKSANKRVAFELLCEHTDKPSKAQVNFVLSLAGKVQ